MEDAVLVGHLEKLDSRLARVEQILPTLATTAELASAIAPLATKEELAAAIAPLATKEELAAAIAPLATKEELAAAIAPLATKEEMRREIHEEGERSRRHMTLLIEHQDGKIQLLAEHVLSLMPKPPNE
jgi:hypothetical protein